MSFTRYLQDYKPPAADIAAVVETELRLSPETPPEKLVDDLVPVIRRMVSSGALWAVPHVGTRENIELVLQDALRRKEKWQQQWQEKPSRCTGTRNYLNSQVAGFQAI